MFTRRTPLYGILTTLGGRMIDRPGYLVSESFTNPKDEHLTTREAAGLFEIFGQFLIEVRGRGAEAFLHHRVVGDMTRLKPGRVVYCSMLSPDGGMIDDVTVFRVDDDRFWVVPAPGRAVVVENYLLEQAGDVGPNVVLLGYKYTSLSLQGPRSRDILREMVEADISAEALPYFGFIKATVCGVPNVIVSRTGFTGELGYELFIPTEQVESLYLQLLMIGSKHGMKTCGLAAMNSLRIEKKYIIFGRDVDEKTSPVEAGLGWTIKLTKPKFVGREVVARQVSEGSQRQLVLLSMDPAVPMPHPGEPVVHDGKTVGKVTTSAMGHSVGKMLALAMLESTSCTEGASVTIEGVFGQPSAQGKVHLRALYDPENKRVRM